MTTTTFSVRAVIPPILAENRVAPEFMPIWSAVGTVVDESPSATFTSEFELIFNATLDAAFAKLVDALAEHVTGNESNRT